MNFIDLATQQQRIRSGIEERLKKVLDHGQYIMGPEIAELEKQLCDYTGARHCIANSSGTDALLLPLMALGIGAGDEVITTPFTFIATGEMIALLGAKAVFVDIDERSYNIDPSKIEAKITAKTKAIMPVSLYGQCADFDAINAIAQKHGLPVIEDAAQSFGAIYKDKKSCNLSSLAATSFFPSKPLGGYGDSGATFTDNDELAEKMRYLRVHGQDRRYHHPLIGINGRMDTMQAAILLEKLTIFPEEVMLRAKIGQRYNDLLATYVLTPKIAAGNTSVYAQYTIRVPKRDSFLKSMEKAEVPTAVHYPIPLHLQPAFAGLNQKEGSFPVAEQVAAEVVSLPMHPYLTNEQQDKVVAAVIDSL